jgi:diguanylate cyclase (GGDEF)-like protein
MRDMPRPRIPQKQANLTLEALHRQNVDLRRQVDHLSTLREIGLAISATLELSQTLPIIANVVQGALDVRRLTLYEPLPGNAGFRPMIAKFGQDLITPDRLAEETVPWQGALAAAHRTRSVIHSDTILQVPLCAKNEVLGVMVLEAPADGLPFAPEDLPLYQQIGSQIALAIHNAKLYALAVTDGLTGLYVRRYFDLRMEEEFAQAQRYARPFALIMSDIDHFKKFNDTHGHQTGDRVLQQFAQLLRNNTRATDICCRYGGEEMAVILPECGREEAATLAEKLRAIIETEPFVGAQGQELHVTTSLGVAAWHSEFTTPTAMVAAADAALYRAKEAGRNRVERA